MVLFLLQLLFSLNQNFSNKNEALKIDLSHCFDYERVLIFYKIFCARVKKEFGATKFFTF